MDRTRCEGYGFCEEKAPTLLRLDSDDELEILSEEVGDDQQDRARLAVRSCPVAALRLEE
ncbi:ferredoxin [Herbiconiux sp. CPCC 203407]|uniref:Ferredoxin n=1 Tax=Herbiconiux oxytropis TaxID=2970915 RepID=A0AA41XAZ0_9MICO|nr:ferredoxin [Herbiconiux oxytropis]MCS5720774.1 ferredoxin [Herbiconiux oxytropis]MCS5724899.1 ferredoxin [Herbiconiux oxytropis]